MYERNELHQEAMELIIEKNLIYITEIINFLGISRQTFYNKFPRDSRAYKDLQTLLQRNKVTDKRTLRAKLMESNSPTAWIKLYRLLGEPDEIARLNGDFDNLQPNQSNEIKVVQVDIEDL